MNKNTWTNLIGNAPIHPALFYSGKIAGYLTWIILILQLFKVDVVEINLTGYNLWVAYTLFIIGLVLIIFSAINLGASTRLGLPLDDTKLKTNGLYRISRNPMYLGFNLVMISSMIYTMNIWVILCGVYSIVIYHFIILGEEVYLENKFGDTYLNYKRQIRRYL